ncbi:MAG: ABC transporter permease [Clostridiales bacterium]|nr:ABC transporter permease [Clostridiales bacterium]
MTVFKMNLLRIVRKKSNFISMFIMPVIFVLLMFTGDVGNPAEPKLAIVDSDNTHLTQLFIENLEKRNEIIAHSEESAKQALIDREVVYVINIASNFTKNILLGNEPMLEGSKIKESIGAFSTNMFIESFMNAVESIAAASGGDEEKFYRGVEEYLRSPFGTKVETYKYDYSRLTMVAGVGFLTMGMLFFASTAALTLVNDKADKTLHRLLITPLTIRQYMIENIACFFLVLLAQTTTIFAFLNVYLGVGWESYFIDLYILAVIFSMLSVAFGIAIASVAKNTRQTSTISSLLITPLVMIGGVFWPSEIMPLFMQRLGYLSPISWFMQAANKIGEGANIFGLYKEIGILLLFTLVFFLVSSFKKVDIAS